MSSSGDLSDDGPSLLRGLDTGDLVLFDRPCTRMGSLYGAFVCLGAKTVSGSPFDHVGVVVRDENGENLLVEAGFSGVAVRPLYERVRRSSASQICVRKLRTHRTEEMRAEARKFVAEVKDLSYKQGGQGFVQMASAALRVHRGKERQRRLHAETVRWSGLVGRLESDLKDESDEEKARLIRERIGRCKARRDRALSLLASKTKASSASHASDNPSGEPSTPATPAMPATASNSIPDGDPPTRAGEKGMFCSELVAALYQRLGLLDARFPSSEDYVPADFAPRFEPQQWQHSEITDGHDAEAQGTGSHRVALLKGAELCPGRWIRGRPVDEPRSSAPSPALPGPSSRRPVVPENEQTRRAAAVESSAAVSESSAPRELGCRRQDETRAWDYREGGALSSFVGFGRGIRIAMPSERGERSVLLIGWPRERRLGLADSLRLGGFACRMGHFPFSRRETRGDSASTRVFSTSWLKPRREHGSKTAEVGGSGDEKPHRSLLGVSIVPLASAAVAGCSPRSLASFDRLPGGVMSGPGVGLLAGGVAATAVAIGAAAAAVGTRKQLDRRETPRSGSPASTLHGVAWW